jgi:hypothetical protein
MRRAGWLTAMMLVVAGVAYLQLRRGITESAPAGVSDHVPLWHRVEGLSVAPSSYAESPGGQAALVDSVVLLRKNAALPWSRFSAGFTPTAVKEAGGGIYVVGTVGEGKGGAPVLLQVLPSPSEVVPVPCQPRDLIVRGPRARVVCDGVTLVSGDGLKTLTSSPDGGGIEPESGGPTLLMHCPIRDAGVSLHGTFPAPAFSLCEGRLLSSSDGGKSYAPEPEIQDIGLVASLWGGERWVAVVVSGALYRRDLR